MHKNNEKRGEANTAPPKIPFLKTLFCRHIYKYERSVLLSHSISFIFDFPSADIKEYAQYDVCIKCGRERITETKAERELTLNEIRKYRNPSWFCD